MYNNSPHPLSLLPLDLLYTNIVPRPQEGRGKHAWYLLYEEYVTIPSGVSRKDLGGGGGASKMKGNSDIKGDSAP